MTSACDKIIQHLWPGARLLSVEPLAGGVSAEVLLLRIVPSGGLDETKLVLRLYGAGDLAERPRVAEEEFRLLAFLQQKALPVPFPHFRDVEGELIGRPLLLQDFVENDDLMPEPKQAALAMADFLLHLHRLPAPEDLRALLPKHPPANGVATFSTALLHGDFWPGNCLWHKGKLAAVVDWEDAGIGDPLYDLATTRLELFWKFDWETVECFTSAYARACKFDMGELPLWDAATAERVEPWVPDWGLPEEQQQDYLEKIRVFRTKALERLAQK